ncbi:MAG: hypothetical protein WBA41_05960, partial [Rivularia sp. (in: cyanobacteria)]
MNSSTTQLLATLEVLLQEEIICRLRFNHTSEWQPFHWESSVKAEFNPISLVYSQGWIKNTDIEIAINNWQEIEQMGVPTLEEYSSYAESVFEDEEDEVDRKSPEFQQRKNIYQQLSNLLKFNLQNLQVYQFSCSADYSCFAIAGQIDDQNWICVTSTVPQETPDFSDIIVTQNNTEILPNKPNTDLESQIDKIIESLTPVLTYGHYDGGYEQTYHHQIIYQTASTKSIALQNALIKSGFLNIGKFKSFYPDNQDDIFYCDGSEEEGEELYNKYQHLNSFLKAKFPEL